MNKTFPKSRICVIDIYPSVEQGLKKAIGFARQHNISLNTADGKKLIFGFCINSIETYYKSQNSAFSKVLCVGSKPKNKNIEFFIKTHFDKIIKQMPIPYCGAIEMNSPDLEMAAQTSLNVEKKQRDFESLASKLKLRWIN